MKILVTACNGQLGTDVVPFFAKNHEVIPYRDVELDITDEAAVDAAFAKHRPDAVVNCAAITNVDGCEAKPELAYKVNAEGAGVIARAAEKVGAALVHISTDYVFAGDGTEPYRETDPVAPRSVYGKSKLAGEQEVLSACKKAYILRTAWLYGPGGNNFVKTMLRIGKEKGEVAVVTDQVGNPTSTFELVRMIDAALRSGRYGVYHATCEGVCSWNEFAREIFRQAGLEVTVKDTTSDVLNRAAPRPAWSVLCKDKMAKECGYRPADWKTALREYFTAVNAAG